MAEVMLQATEWTAVELAGGTGDLLHIFGSFNAPVLELGDGTVVHIPGDPVSSFPAWCVAMERSDLVADERFATREARHANRSEMLAVLQEFASTFERFDEFEAALSKGRLAVGEVKPLTDVHSAAWARERDALVDVGDENGGPLQLASVAVPLLRGHRGHDRKARVARSAQPRGAPRGARPERRRARAPGSRWRAREPFAVDTCAVIRAG